MRKPGIIFGGYDSEHLPFIDRPVRELVRAMNAVPYLVTYSSCGGHRDGFYQDAMNAVVDFEVHDRRKAEHLYRRILRQNWVDRHPDAWVDISRQFHNSYNFNRFGAPPEHRDELISSEQLNISGFGEKYRTARKHLDAKIAELTDLFWQESRR